MWPFMVGFCKGRSENHGGKLLSKRDKQKRGKGLVLDDHKSPNMYASSIFKLFLLDFSMITKL
ncbi:hypothetical protein SLEP1_g12040 [Rubroshorea leprosula]|nr:hypothetical protein SLEP1_g12040 [Rubroshorea leprosula]